MKEPKTLCDTCVDRELCGSNSRELISPDAIDHLKAMGITAKATVYKCATYKQDKLPQPISQTALVFTELDSLRGYKPPKRNAEAASIIRMLKLYTAQKIIEIWKIMKQDKFYQNKELYMMTVESQIGAMINGTHQQGNQQHGFTEGNTGKDSKYIKGTYGSIVRH